jgi:DNA modification methylase
VLAGQYGMDYEVDVRVASRELTERERQQLTVYLHRGATGDWDMDLLANTFELDDLLVWGFDEGELLGFDFSEEKTAGSDTEPQVDKADELRQKWGVSLGQMWALGEHRIICGDCTDPATVARLMGGEKASIVFTDPPYGVSIGAKNRMLNSFQPSGRNLTDIEDDSATPEELKERLLPAFINIRKMVMADDCTVFLTAPQNGELGMMMMMMMKEAGLLIRHVLIWKKNAPTFSMGKLDYDYQHEPILLTWGKRHKRPMLGTHKTSVWEIDKPRASADHPTMKPVELYTNAYLNNSESGDVAYEPYSGSGTALIACQNLNRKCRAVEISPAYTSVAIERFFQHTGITPVLMD